MKKRKEAKRVDPDALVDIIRYSRDPEERRRAVSELEKLGMVESLDHAPPDRPISTRPAATPAVADAPGAPPISIGPLATVRALPARKKTLLLLVFAGALYLSFLLAEWAPVETPSKPNVPPPRLPTPQARTRAVARHNDGLMHSSRGEYEEAIADYTEAIRLDPTYAMAYRSRGVAHHHLGEFEEAISDYTEAIRLDPDYAMAYYDRGIARADLGEYEEAIADYTEAIRLDPEYAVAYNNLAWTMAYDLDTNYEEALEYALRAVELDPSEYHHDTLALVYYKLERYQEALEHYSLALSVEPDFAASYKGRGDVYLALGDTQAALDDYETYLDLEPEAPDRKAVEETMEELRKQVD